MGVKDLAKKIATSRSSSGGNHLKDGRGVCIVKALKHESLYKGETFIAELQVESSESVPEARDASGAQIQANAPGSSFSFIQQFDEYPDTAFGNTKSFILTLMGETEESLARSAAATKAELVKAGKLKAGEDYTADDEFAASYERLVGSAQPARGMRIRFETFRKLSKKSGILLVLPRWETVPQTVEQIAATRAAMDSLKP